MHRKIRRSGIHIFERIQVIEMITPKFVLNYSPSPWQGLSLIAKCSGTLLGFMTNTQILTIRFNSLIQFILVWYKSGCLSNLVSKEQEALLYRHMSVEKLCNFQYDVFLVMNNGMHNRTMHTDSSGCW